MTTERTNGEGTELKAQSLLDRVRSGLASSDMEPFFVGGEVCGEVYGEVYGREGSSADTTFRTIFFVAPKYPVYDSMILNPVAGNIINRLGIGLDARGHLPHIDESGRFMFFGTVEYEEILAIRRTREIKTAEVFQESEVQRLGINVSPTDSTSEYRYQQCVILVVMPDPRLAYVARTVNGREKNAAYTLLLEAGALNLRALTRLEATKENIPGFLAAVSQGNIPERREVFKLMFGTDKEKEFVKLQLSRR